MRDGYNTSPINQLPMVAWAMAVPMAVIEAVLWLSGTGLLGNDATGWRIAMFERFKFSPAAFDWMLTNGVWPFEIIIRTVSYAFVHVSPMHALFAVVLVLALGKFVGEVFRAWAVLAVFFASVIAGALVFALLPGQNGTLIGAYPGAYGLIGGLTFIIWARLGASNANRARAFTMIGFLMGFQLVFGLVDLMLGGSGAGTAANAIADISGFAAGFLLSFLVSPGGWARAMARLRQR